MTLDELIARLQELRAQYGGEIEVVYSDTEQGDGIPIQRVFFSPENYQSIYRSYSTGFTYEAHITIE